MLQTINLPQHHLRAGTHTDVVRQVDPLYGARGVYQELGGPRNVPSVFARACVQNSVSANRFRLRIGKEGEGITLVLAKLARLHAGVYADGDYPDAARAKLV